MTAPDDAVKAVTALQFNAPWDPWGLTPDEARTVIAAAMPHIRAQIAADIERIAAEHKADDEAEKCDSRFCAGWILGQAHAAGVVRGESL